MTREERTRLIDRYAEGPIVVAAALDGFPADQLTAHPLPGKWSAAQIAHHLADSESVGAARVRTLLVDHEPVIHGYDPDVYAETLRYDARPVAPALDVLRAVRALTAQLLRTLTDEQWARTGTHTESGPWSVEKWLVVYSEHAHKHAGQIDRLRAALGAAQPAANASVRK